LDRSNRRIHHHPTIRLPLLLQASLPHPPKLGSWRLADELALPSQPQRKRLCSEPSRFVPFALSRSSPSSLTPSYSPSTEAAYGSKLTLKNIGYGGGLLHSHVQTYPVGSNQQQVTCYHYKDDNNQWIITPTWEAEPLSDTGDIRFLKDNDIVRLVHASTGRNLHSHPIAAPVTKLNNEISCYGNATIGDSNDYWIVEVVDDSAQGKKKNVKRIHSLTTRLRFRHQNSGCYIRAANTVLPQWGFKQIEVSCDKENNVNDVHTYWNIESHWNERRELSVHFFSIRRARS